MTRLFISAFDCISPAGRGIGRQLSALFEEQTFLRVYDDISEGRLDEAIREELSAMRAEKELRVQDPLLLLSLSLLRSMPQVSSHWGTITGSSRGPTHSLENAWMDFNLGKALKPYISPVSTASSLSSGVARELGLRGPNLSLSAACATGLHTIIQGAGSLLMGLCPGVVALSAEYANTPFTKDMLKAAKVLTPSLHTYPCQPGGDSRSGMVLSEGAAAIFLETDPEQPALAEIVGWGAATESASLTGVSLEGDGLEKAAVNALNRAGIEATDIDLVIGHGAGTKKGDAAEYSAYSRLFSQHPPLVWHKWCTGHMLGASAAYSLMLGITHLSEGRVPPHPYFPDHHPMRGVRLLTRKRYALAWSMGFGGNACALIVKNPF